LVKRLIVSELAERRAAGENPNWTEILGAVMANINSQHGRMINSVSAYEAIFGQLYDQSVSCSLEEARECWTVEQRLKVTQDIAFVQAAKQFFGDTEGDQQDEEDSWCDEELTDEEMMNLDEVDDATFDLHCPVKLLDDTAKHQVLLDIASLSPEKVINDTEQDMVESQESSPAANIVDSVLEKEGLFMYNKPPPPLPVDHPRLKKQVTLSEAWNQKLTVSASRKTKARSDELYTFVYLTMTCATCFPDTGVFRISVGDERYNTHSETRNTMERQGYMGCW
jgi:hypothetical protein